LKKKILSICIVVLLIALVLPMTGTTSMVKNDASGTSTVVETYSSPIGSTKVDWWPMFGHNQNHSHYSTSTAPNTNRLLWSYNTGDSFVESSPAVVDGKVYVKTGVKVICVDASSGGLEWSYPIEDWSDSSPAVADGKVYVGSGHADGKIYCLDAYSGDLIWSYTTGLENWIDSSPVVAYGKVYVGSSNGKVYCLDALTGKLDWSYYTGFWCWVQSSPAVAEGNVYVGVVDNWHQNGRVLCLDASSGGLVWSYNTNDYVDSSPAVAYGKVYVGSWDYNVYCLDAYSGDLVWSYQTGSFVTSSPAVAYGKVYVGSMDHNMFCLDAYSGGLIWWYTTDDRVISSPAVADGKIYVGSLDSKVYCLNASSGGLVWTYTTGSTTASSPAVANGYLYVGSDDNYVYVFGPNPPVFGMPNPANGSTGQPTSLSWSIPINDPEGDLFSWAIQCSNGQQNSATNATNGTKSLALSGLANATNYKVWVNATDPGGSGLYTRRWYTFGTIGGNQPPNPPIIRGPASGKVKHSYNYTFNSTDPNEDNIFYYIDWGDNTNSGWIGPNPSGHEITQTHTWPKGTYTIKAKAKDNYGYESDWATLSVTMPYMYRIPYLPFWEELFEQFPNAFPILRHLMGY
jgi:outer membrane protein assembly factor BamB